jgi:signal transduction histidine kinase
MAPLRVTPMVSSIWQRYVAFSILLAVLIAASCAFLGVAVVLGSDSAKSWRDSTKTIAGVDSLNGDLIAVETAVHGAIESDNPKPMRLLLSAVGPASRQADEIFATADTQKEREIATRLRASERGLIQTWFTPGVESWGQTTPAEKRARSALLDRQVGAGRGALLEFVTAKQQAAEEKGYAATTLRTRVLIGAAVLLTLVLGLMVAAAVQLGRLVVRPARALEHAVSRVTQGDLETAVPVDGPSELASIATKFNLMRAALKAEREREEERMRARLELASAKQEAARLESLNIVSGGVAHEFNNLLQAIVGQAELLRNDIPERARVGFDDIERAAWKAGRLARTMLLASGQGAYDKGDVAAADVLAELDDFPGCTVGVVFGSIEPEQTLLGDVSHLRQAIGAVIANAGEAYGEGGGKVTVRVDCQVLRAHELARLTHNAALPGVFVVFTIEDSGEGMTPQTASKAFDPFFTTRFPGRGLGLATVLGVVRGHHGAVDVASEPAAGTAVRLFFPVGG